MSGQRERRGTALPYCCPFATTKRRKSRQGAAQSETENEPDFTGPGAECSNPKQRSANGSYPRLFRLLTGGFLGRVQAEEPPSSGSILSGVRAVYSERQTSSYTGSRYRARARHLLHGLRHRVTHSTRARARFHTPYPDGSCVEQADATHSRSYEEALSGSRFGLGASGSVTVNADPRPTSLETTITPPCRFTIQRAMA